MSGKLDLNDAAATAERVAIWGWRETDEAVEQFRMRCPNCQSDAPFDRIRRTRSRTVFWIRITPGAEIRHLLRCRRCDADTHPRDVEDLTVPELRRRYGEALRAGAAFFARQSPDAATRHAAVEAVRRDRATYSEADLDADIAALDERDHLDRTLVALSEEAGPPITERYVGELAAIVAAGGADVGRVRAAIEPIGERLFLSTRQFDRVVGSSRS